jgi:hypothetical protein
MPNLAITGYTVTVIALDRSLTPLLTRTFTNWVGNLHYDLNANLYGIQVSQTMYNSYLSLQSVGILSSCNCSRTKFGELYVPGGGTNPSVRFVNIAYGDPAVVVTANLYDSVSYSCGFPDMYNWCNATRTFSIVNKVTGLVETALIQFTVSPE